MAVGADLNTLKSLHRTFTEKAAEASDIKNQVEGALAAADWTGRNSDQFREAWADYRANLDRLRDALDGAASDVKANHNNIAAATGEPDRI